MKTTIRIVLLITSMYGSTLTCASHELLTSLKKENPTIPFFRDIKTNIKHIQGLISIKKSNLSHETNLWQTSIHGQPAASQAARESDIYNRWLLKEITKDELELLRYKFIVEKLEEFQRNTTENPVAMAQHEDPY